jgi:hypothetical protein
MNLLQRICSAVIDASDAFGASMQGVDVQTHRVNLYGHAGGIVAARIARERGDPIAATHPFPTEVLGQNDDDSDLAWGASPPHSVAINSADPMVRAHAHDLADESTSLCTWGHSEIDSADCSHHS